MRLDVWVVDTQPPHEGWMDLVSTTPFASGEAREIRKEEDKTRDVRFGTAYYHKNDRNAAGCFGPLGRRHPTASRRVDGPRQYDALRKWGSKRDRERRR
ncbi:hypothetical protein PRIPAC_80273 [Pristionchus pacificus]|uniref:Uncharacterized protein n=1 Tax=Pristionchus pacificus TaxID=54126 RepID=A0A2A6C4W1_PRIPA|nr:hypothetical protein PRIPAC_80273 [Pristionchus pacificus]|eukprot:PDM73061.1 hypothetical protein PRIPAC_39495 [Pristionchus pacificus]